MRVKEESEKAGLKLNIQKTKIMASGPITSWRIDGETMETVTDFIFLGSKITVDGDCSHKIKKTLWKKRYDKARQSMKSRDIISLTKVCMTLCYCLLNWVSVQFTQSCPTLYNPMNHGMPALPAHHQVES